MYPYTTIYTILYANIDRGRQSNGYISSDDCPPTLGLEGCVVCTDRRQDICARENACDHTRIKKKKSRFIPVLITLPVRILCTIVVVTSV